MRATVKSSVALVDGSDTTLKRFYREPNGMARLQPANPAMQPIHLPRERLQLQGRVPRRASQVPLISRLNMRSSSAGESPLLLGTSHPMDPLLPSHVPGRISTLGA